MIKRIFNRDFTLPQNVDKLYLTGFLFEQLLNLARSLKYLPFRKISSGRIFLNKSVSIKCKSKVTIASGVKIGKSVQINGFGRIGITIGRGSSIGDYSKLICSGSFSNMGEFITIGNGVGIGEFSRIGGSGGVTIGDNTIIAQYFSAHPENHLFLDKTTLIKNQGTEKAEIKIGQNCWIGSKVTILAGVEIGEGVVVAAGSVVTKSFGSHVVIGGVPARVIKEY